MLQNIKISKDIQMFILGCLVGLLLFFLFQSKDKKIVEVPVEIEVPVPVIDKKFDTIKLPGEIVKEIKIDSIYYKQYLKLKTFIEKDSAYKNAIKIREYNPIFEDDTIRIESYTKVRGTLLENQISYKTKPYKIKLDTIINVIVPKKAELYVGGGVILPTQSIVNKEPSLEAGIFLVNKKHNKSFNFTYDPINQNAGIGIYFRL